MKMPYFILLASFFCIMAASCSRAQNREVNRKTEKEFRLPDVPATLTAPEERAAYLSLHYWDHFDFTDTTLISQPEITEQAFVDFVSILPYTPEVGPAVNTLFSRAAAGKDMLRHFIALADKYLYEPNSPMHDEELYIPVLRALITSSALDESEKARPRFRLEMALKNRPGDTAADFAVTCRNGKRLNLSGLKADYTLLYFNDPDCEDCRRVREQLSASAVLNGLLESGRLKLISICVEGKTDAWEQATFPARWIDGYDAGQYLTRERVYDLKAMPTLYLLDVGKRVILKDAPVERIEKWLSEKNLPQNANGCPR